MTRPTKGAKDIMHLNSIVSQISFFPKTFANTFDRKADRSRPQQPAQRSTTLSTHDLRRIVAEMID